MSNQTDVDVTIAGHRVKIARGLRKGSEVRAAGHVPEDKQLLLEIKGELDVPITSTDLVLISGGEEFSVGGKPLPENPDRICPLQIKVNHKEHSVTKAKLTAAEILKLHGPAAEGSLITLDIDHLPDEPIPAGARIVLARCLMFMVTPSGNVGYTGLETQFAELKTHYPTAQLVGLGGNSMVLVPGFQLRPGWSVEKTDLMFLVPQGFPTGALDMFYTTPTLTLADGRQPGNADQVEQHGGKAWRRFSWHYQHPWKPGRDTLLSHLTFCRARLQTLQ